MKYSVLERYEGLVGDGGLALDVEQLRVIRKLDALGQRLSEAQMASKGSALGWLFSSRVKPEVVTGLYIWGSVGRGKTMLMDLFFGALGFRKKRRAHFHAFMGDVHERIHTWRQASRRGEVKGNDPIGPVADALAREATLLCFDEFSVTDIADAMLLGRLFEALFARGVTVVATSNVEPGNLYKDGLNRALFVPFIKMIGERMDIVQLDARIDYRMEKLAGASVFYTPLNAAAHQALAHIFDHLSGGVTPQSVTVHVKGRQIQVPKVAHGIAWMLFHDLCEKPLGAADYLEIARAFHTLVLEGVPAMTQDNRNEAKRFITLIDVLYDNGVKVIISSEAEVQEIYRGERGAEVFEFGRTVSRLIEMRSEQYLSRPHGRANSDASGDSTGLVET